MELLKNLLDEETYAQVEEQLKDKDIKLANLNEGGFVSIEKFNRLNKDLEDTQTELKTRTEELTKLGEDSSASEELKAKLDKIKEDFEIKEQEYQERLKQNEVNSVLEKAILKSGTIDEVSVKAHLSSFLEGAEFKDGEIVGLDEQLNSLKEEKKYLFENTVGTGVKHRQPISSNEPTLEEDIANKIFNKQ